MKNIVLRYYEIIDNSSNSSIDNLYIIININSHRCYASQCIKDAIAKYKNNSKISYNYANVRIQGELIKEYQYNTIEELEYDNVEKLI